MPKALAVLCSILFVFAGSGCSGSVGTNSNTPSTPNQVAMQAGQWEFTIASTNNPNIFIEADITTTPLGGSQSSQFGTALFWNQTGGRIAGLYEYCVSLQTTFSITGNTVTALLFDATTTNQIAHATATLSTDAKSMTGTFQLDVNPICGAPISPSGGTFTGQVIAPLDGTYKGSLSDGSQLTIQVVQDSSFNISATGNSMLNGVTTNLTIGANSGSPAAYNNVIGATVSSDNGTATNVNGSSTFQVFGHFSPDASQISFASSNGQWITGTLTKQ
jgi:hypothetical protein